jgi:uncharacterized protein (TIGR01777 family)
MRVAVTGATGLIGRRLVERLKARGDEVTALARDPDRAGAALGVEAVPWDGLESPAPAEAVRGRDAVVHLAGEPVAQRWTGSARRRIHDTRETGTRNLVAGLREASPRPGVLASASGVDYYGARGEEEVTEADAPGADFLARVCRAWEGEAQRAEELGLRVARLRTGVVLSRRGGALGKMLPPFRLGVGGPVAGGRQWMPWIHHDDIVGMYLAALGDGRWSGPVNACAPRPVTNREFSKALGRALRRPAIVPVPAAALRLLYGEMALIVTTGRRAIPRRALNWGFPYAHPDLDEALSSALQAPRPDFPVI